jgi:hypothetical protein
MVVFLSLVPECTVISPKRLFEERKANEHNQQDESVFSHSIEDRSHGSVLACLLHSLLRANELPSFVDGFHVRHLL